MPDSHRQLLTSGIQQLNITLTEQQINSLLDYVKLLYRWNKAYNLTAVRNEEEMLTKHLLDSLSVVPFFANEKKIADIGSGPGLPGIVLAICYPDLAVTTVDSNGKKTRFMEQAVMELTLSNVTVHHSRVEDLDNTEQFSVITSRAFASLTDMLRNTAHLLQKGGKFLAMKGVYPEEELRDLPAGFKVCAVHPLQVPYLQAERHLVEIVPE